MPALLPHGLYLLTLPWFQTLIEITECFSNVGCTIGVLLSRCADEIGSLCAIETRFRS